MNMPPAVRFPTHLGCAGGSSRALPTDHRLPSNYKLSPRRRSSRVVVIALTPLPSRARPSAAEGRTASACKPPLRVASKVGRKIRESWRVAS